MYSVYLFVLLYNMVYRNWIVSIVIANNVIIINLLVNNKNTIIITKQLILIFDKNKFNLRHVSYYQVGNSIINKS